MMTRRISVFTLNNIEDLKPALEELKKTASLLPEGALLQAFVYSDEGMPELLPGLFFGDLVQIIDFPKAWQASEFPESEAYRDQLKRTGGLFTNITALNYNLEETNPS